MRPITEIQWNKLQRGKDTIKMKPIKQQIQDFKTNTPKHIQWILLGAAFVVVIILLTLILGKKSEDTAVDNANTNVSFVTDPNKINLTNVAVDSYSSETVNISVNMPVVIQKIDIDSENITLTNNCDNLTDFCMINVVYRPKTVQQETTQNIQIKWYIESQPDTVQTTEIPVTYSSWKKEEPKPVVVEPVIEPVVVEPVVEPEPIVEEKPMDAIAEIKTIAVENPFKDEEISEPIRANQCSEFAIPGYDQSGRQIGWIKPVRGANYFYPLADKTCSNPTGKYDLTTGIITSLEDGSKIGTDSDHIGYRNVRSRNLNVPQLATPRGKNAMSGKFGEDAVWTATGEGGQPLVDSGQRNKFDRTKNNQPEVALLMGSAGQGESVTSSLPYDRTFILRQFKPIPATIVSEVRADPSVYGYDKSGNLIDKNANHSIPVRATVDRNVFSDDGRTIILPTGTLLMGYLDGKLPGPYQAFGRMNIRWYQFIRPDGVEFNFAADQDPYSADAQGRMGVPGHGSTDYVEQMVMPILTALVPAAVNMIAPITDTVINQIDLDNNTVVQSGTIRSSEMAKQDIINTWNKITQKLLVDAIDNTVPPFSIAAGTRINVFSPVDLIVSCQGVTGKKCSVITANTTAKRRSWSELKTKATFDSKDPSFVGQVRSFNLNQYCKMDSKTNKITIDNDSPWGESGYDYRTVLAYCEAQNYQAINNAKQAAYNESVKTQAEKKYGNVTYNQTTGQFSQSGSDEQKKAYNQDILGLKYDEEDNIINPWEKPNDVIAEEVLTCEDGNAPDANGCCTGETYTDMGEDGFNCCPDTGGDCFPPITVE